MNEDKVKKILLYGIAGLVGFGAGMTTGTILSNYPLSPKTAYIQDLNGDGREDITIVNQRGNKGVLMQLENGTYVPLEEYSKLKEDEVRGKSNTLDVKIIREDN